MVKRDRRVGRPDAPRSRWAEWEERGVLLIAFVGLAVIVVLAYLWRSGERDWFERLGDRGNPLSTADRVAAQVVGNERRATPSPMPTYTRYPTYTPYPTPAPPTATARPTPSATPLVGTRARPAPLGLALPAIIGDKRLDVNVLQVVTGTDAATRVVAANRFNAAPKAGHEYVLFYARVKVVQGPPDTVVRIREFDFTLVDSEGRLWTPPVIVDPEPALDGAAFAGATIEGWGTHQRRAGDKAYLVYGMDISGHGGVWYEVP